MSITRIKRIESICKGNDNSDQCKISSDSKHIALSGKSVLLYNINQEIVTYIGYGGVDEWNMCFSHNSTYLAFINERKEAFLYNIKDKVELLIANQATHLHFGDNGHYLFIVTKNRLIVYKIEDGSRQTIDLPFTPVRLSQWKDHLLCTNYQREFILIHLPTMKLILPDYPLIDNLTYSDGDLYWDAFFYHDKIMYESHHYGYNYIEIHDLTKKKTYFNDLSSAELILDKNMTHTLGGFIIRGLQFLNDESIIYGGDCGSINIWDFVKNTTITLPTYQIVYGVTIIDNDHIAYVCDSKLHIWTISKNTVIDAIEDLERTTEYCYSLNKDRSLVTNDCYKSISIWKFDL